MREGVGIAEAGSPGAEKRAGVEPGFERRNAGMTRNVDAADTR